MSENTPFNHHSSHDSLLSGSQHDSSAFDVHHLGEHHPHWYNTFSGTEHSVYGNEAIIHHADPLSVSHDFAMKPLNIHYVKPHLMNITDEHGLTKTVLREGHLRTNPDGIIENNLGYLFGDH